jgi:predicted metal-binding protein
VTASSTLYICTTCRGGDPAAAEQPRAGARLLAAVAGGDVAVVGVECLSNCARSCSAAIVAPGKWTYVIGNLDPDRHAGDILTFARQHGAHEAGLPVWRERPEHIRKNTIARVPPMPIREPS